MFEKKIMDALVVFDENPDTENNDQSTIGLLMNGKKERNLDILIPFKDEKSVPDYLIDFIQNDPNFVPEIHCNNLEDAFLNMH
jgi:hypothetical protein